MGVSGELDKRLPFLIVGKEGKVIEKVCLDGQDRFVLGRQSDCNIVASHASISRCHLEIRINSDTGQFLIADLQSVHGSKLNGQQLQPFQPAIVEKNDSFQIGASTRVYNLRWLPPQASFEGSDSCSSKLDAAISKRQICKESNSQPKDPSQLSWHVFQAPVLHSLINPNKEDAAIKLHSGSRQMTSARRSPLSFISGSSPGLRESPLLRKPSLDSPATKLLPPDSPLLKNSLAQSPICHKPRSRLKLKPTKLQAPSSLWQKRRCNSTPLPQLVTTSVQKLPTFKQAEETPNHSKLSLTTQNADDASEYYPSDKENLAPSSRTPAKKPQKQERQPFQPLPVPSPTSQNYRPVFQPVSCTSSEEDSFKALGLPKHLRQSILAETMDQMMRKLKVSESSREPRLQWHIIVDTNCFLEAESLKALQQLEGVKEIRIIVPKIVIRELDFMKRRENLRSGAHAALKWIEDCMVKLPTWIHVQSSSETRTMGITPPISPAFSSQNFSQYGSAIDLLSPTNDDHILDCALLFERTVSDGQVVLLTKDTALKIKAMAEGLLSEGAAKFCESLLDPYSDRFVWGGANATLRPVWSDKSGLRNNSSSSTIANSNNTSESRKKGMMVVPSLHGARKLSHGKKIDR